VVLEQGEREAMEEPSAVENYLADSLAEELERPEAVKADHWKNIGNCYPSAQGKRTLPSLFFLGIFFRGEMV